MGVFDFLRRHPSYNAKRAYVRRWLDTVEFPDPDDLPFSDIDSDSDESEDDFAGFLFVGMRKFDYSQHTVAYSQWQDPFATGQAAYKATYSNNVNRGTGNPNYKRVLLPVQEPPRFTIPNQEEDDSDDSDDTDSDDNGKIQCLSFN
jgi:hypothetical protein